MAVGTDRRVRRWLVGIAGLAVAARLAWLGRRPVHFDEARVGMAILDYLRTGEYLYYPALHGPLLFHANRPLFSVFGPTDAVLRLPVAVVGGLLPLAAWLYRDHLTDGEVVAMGALLAANPLLLYYSRFARSDLLVAAFALVAFGFGLRLLATGRPRYLYAGALAFALALASKENALLYALSWAGGGLGLWVVSRSRRAGTWPSTRRPRLPVDRSFIGHGALAGLAVAGVLTLLYAPQGGTGPRLDAVSTLGDAAAVVSVALVGSFRRLLAVWVYGGGHPPDAYLRFLGHLLGLLAVTSIAVVALAIVGAAVEWRGRERPRRLVTFALMWAGLGIVGYPLASDLVAAWTVVHVVVPLTIPGAVGLAAVVGSARTAAAPHRRRRATAGLVIVLVVVVGVSGWSSYAAPGAPYNPFGQPGQPTGELPRTIADVEAVAETAPGTDVAYVGPFYRTALWRLPFEWYLEPAGVVTAWRALPLEDPPPVVIALDVNAEALAPVLSDYVCREHDPYPWGEFKPGGRLTQTVVYVDRQALAERSERWRPVETCRPGRPANRPLARWLDS